MLAGVGQSPVIDLPEIIALTHKVKIGELHKSGLCAVSKVKTKGQGSRLMSKVKVIGHGTHL